MSKFQIFADINYNQLSVDLSILIGDIVLIPSALFRTHVEIVARPLKFDTSDRFACIIQAWKAKNLPFPTICRILSLVKPFGNYALLNTRSTAKNLHSKRDLNFSAWNQYYRPTLLNVL